MPFCPTCQSEYRADFTQCATCKVPLVASLERLERLGEAEEAVHFAGKPRLMVTQGAAAACMEIQDALEQGGCVSRIVPMEGQEDAPPVHNMFLLEIVEADLDKARRIMGDRWKAALAREGGLPTSGQAGEAILAAGSETECPACNHKFTPVKVESAECPECGLFLGVPA